MHKSFAKGALMKLPSSIDIRSLYFFVNVYEARNYTVVARKEDVSASMISRTISHLEDALGHQLFYRSTRAIAPTEAGHVFYEYANNILGQYTQAHEVLRDKQNEPHGLVRINAPVFFGQRHIAPWIGALLRKYPKLRIELSQTDNFIDPLQDGADLLFRIGSMSDSTMHARVFGHQYYHLAASAAYLDRYGTPQTPAELAGHQCLIYKGEQGANRWFFKQESEGWQEYQVPALITSNNAESLLTAALDDVGIVLFPDWLIGEHLYHGRLIKLLTNYAPAISTKRQQIAAIYPHTRYPPLNVRVVIDYFVQVYGAPLYWQYK